MSEEILTIEQDLRIAESITKKRHETYQND